VVKNSADRKENLRPSVRGWYTHMVTVVRSAAHVSAAPHTAHMPIRNIIIIIDILIIIWCIKHGCCGNRWRFYILYYTYTYVRNHIIVIIYIYINICWFLATAVVTPWLCSRNNSWVCRRLFFLSFIFSHVLLFLF